MSDRAYYGTPEPDEERPSSDPMWGSSGMPSGYGFIPTTQPPDQVHYAQVAPVYTPSLSTTGIAACS